MKTLAHQLDYRALSAKPNGRMIDSALKDDSLLQTTFIGQARAREALSFGLGIRTPGYNLYVMGESATGRHTLVQEYVGKQAAVSANASVDWCYINNFEDEREPYALRLAAGEGKRLQGVLSQFIDELLDTFPAVFDNPNYQRKKAAAKREYDKRYNGVIDDLEALAQARGMALYEEGSNVSFSPVINNTPITDEEFAKLSTQERQHYCEIVDGLEQIMSERLIEIPQWKRQLSEKLRKLKKQTAEEGIRPLIKKLEHRYASELGILKYLRQLKPHLVQTVIDVLATDSKDDKHDEFDKRSYLEEQYLPNVLTAHDVAEAAPIVYEPNPTYQNVFGRIEYSSSHGALFTNYRMIRAGALHRANGGYLLLDADRMIQQPHVWESLQLALKFGHIKMDIPQQDYGMVNSMMLNPQPIAVDVKVVLLGTRDLYYTMREYDDEFAELFRVLVDFDHDIELDKTALFEFVGQVRKHLQRTDVRAISKAAISRLLEYSLRLAEHQQRLTASFAPIIELLQEAGYFCRAANLDELDVTHIEKALQAKQRRSDRISQSLLDDINNEQILIATEGAAVGKINGLSVLEIGDSVIGTPTCISATVYPGSAGVVDIEREVELGKSIHSKGIMLLTGYLGHKYAMDFPLTLSANIANEQSYGYIDGDSASLAELIALLSALTDLPVMQTLAVTGSINQYGQVQPVGGVNEKIEGFFQVCKARGLTGEQGVLIPQANCRNLMLHSEVLDAVKAGQFAVYTAATADAAITLLMAKEAGQLTRKKRYPKGTVNHTAVAKLRGIYGLVNGAQDG